MALIYKLQSGGKALSDNTYVFKKKLPKNLSELKTEQKKEIKFYAESKAKEILAEAKAKSAETKYQEDLKNNNVPWYMKKVGVMNNTPEEKVKIKGELSKIQSKKDQRSFDDKLESIGLDLATSILPELPLMKYVKPATKLVKKSDDYIESYNKYNSIQKKLTDETHALKNKMYQLAETKPTKSVENVKGELKNIGYINKPNNANYLNEFDLRFVNPNKFKIDNLKIIAEHGKQPLLKKKNFPNLKTREIDSILENSFIPEEQLQNAKTISDLHYDNGWGLNFTKTIENHMNKNNISLEDLKNRALERKNITENFVSHNGSVNKHLANEQMHYSKYKDKNYDIDVNKFAEEAEDIQLSPEELLEFSKEEKLNMLKQDLKNKFKGIDAFQGIKLNKKGGIIYGNS